ncbi:cysteine synthase 2 [Trichodelitschia bisporula]|uniref:Cysteine synthase 2 n=1 Tax=Trichodelitschia bisporula TaxID=703511 RepID=A0A6G1HXH2_9PEZI|nr:cysteine synthase 2 [Trichodelitschia bisporula]
MSETKTRIYVGLSFLAGILLTLGFKDVYPDLERRYQRSRNRVGSIFDRLRPPGRNVELKDATDPHAHDVQPTDYPEGIESTIGNTPIFKIKSLSEATGCTILAKAEFLNGAGNSPKDRVALNIVSRAESAGLLTPHSGDTVYEGTVGSTGISLATICRARGYHAHICIPSDQSPEKTNLLLALGATVSPVPPAPIVDTNQFVNLARRLAAEHTADPARPGRGLFADQFESEANWHAHFAGTGPEILSQTGGKLDAFVSGAGTGGTISGVALFLKPRVKGLKVVLADPQGSGLFNRVRYGVMFDAKEREGTRRRHQVDTIVEGIGINRVTRNFEVGRELVDDAVRVSDEQALAMARWLVEKDGIFIGSSSSVNCVAATQVALQMGPGHTIVTLLCDSGARHLSKFWAKAGVVADASGTSLDEVLNAVPRTAPSLSPPTSHT